MRISALALTIALALTTAFAAGPTGAGFSYQGRLQEAGNPANGLFDLRFALFSSESAAMPIGSALTNSGVAVSNGLFQTTLDFGANVFSGGAGWLEIGVRPVGGGEFVALSPRQSLTPVPYSIYTLRAETLAGMVPDALLSTNVARLSGLQRFSGSLMAVDLSVEGGVRASNFTGNGAGLSNITANALSIAALEKLWRMPIAFVNVTNAGNEADVTGLGAVARDYRIGKFEINNRQYVAFLNAVAADDPYLLFSTNMTVDAHGGITRSGSPGDYAYAAKPGMEHRPVVWVDFRDAVRFCNWLHNGQPSGAEDKTTTEDGAYTITPAMLMDTLAWEALLRNAGARYFLPNDDEWYKAAYHQPWFDGGDESEYWLYPTRSNDVPFAEPPPGSENSVNARDGSGRGAVDVGSYLNARSFYGTFDQGGNVQEWTESVLFISSRSTRGGSWEYNEFYAKSTDVEFDTVEYDAPGIGFRVAAVILPK